MDGPLEQQRRSHEERERLVDTMVREWLHEKKTHKEKINSEHRLKLLFDRYADTTYSLKKLYKDNDGSRKDEVAAIGGPNEFTEFYNRLKNLKEFHRTHPNDAASSSLAVEFHEMNEAIEDPNRVETDLVDFTDEEGYGRYLDMHQLQEKYINLKGAEKIDYLSYIANFDRLYQYPKERKLSAAYRQYVSALLEYLTDFLGRIRPLVDINEEVKKAVQDFEKKWAEGTFPGWPKQEQVPKSALAHGAAGYLDLSPYNTVEELMTLGLDRLKSALSALGLKCGGTLEERAKRLLATKGKRLEDLDISLFAKPPGSNQQQQKQPKEDMEQEKKKDIAMLEAQVYHFTELVGEQREATKENVERKQARVPGEDDEEEEEVVQPPSDDDDDDDIPYNPKNLPLGWDGKPIPYWLYKLHGLNIDFPCEICGNQVYKGPKAFQRHFSEWRHAHGMRCLGIPNTAHFANVIKIQEALQLWERLREQKELERFKPEVDEEYEDSQGNVVNKKTYEDLRRQGLL